MRMFDWLARHLLPEVADVQQRQERVEAVVERSAAVARKLREAELYDSMRRLNDRLRHDDDWAGP